MVELHEEQDENDALVASQGKRCRPGRTIGLYRGGSARAAEQLRGELTVFKSHQPLRHQAASICGLPRP